MKHVLRKGERLEHLSARYKVPVCMIVRANGYETDKEEFEIPRLCYCNKCRPERKWTRFAMRCVGQSETAEKIAQRHGLSVDELTAMNGMCGADEIRPGVVIGVPVG